MEPEIGGKVVGLAPFDPRAAAEDDAVTSAERYGEVFEMTVIIRRAGDRA